MIMPATETVQNSDQKERAVRAAGRAGRFVFQNEQKR
jgi:hypothetical protein